MEIPHTAIRNQIGALADALLAALDSGDPAKIRDMQQIFSQAAGKAWEVVDELALNPREKAIPRLIVHWAVDELPEQIQDPANYPEIRRQLHLLKNSMEVLFD